MRAEEIISRHRLPQPLRSLLTVFWLAPVGLLALTLIASHGLGMTLFDPRLLAAFLLMSLPGLYVWREGVDVTDRGLRVWSHRMRSYTYAELGEWHYERHPGPRLLIVWTRRRCKVLECPGAHLTDLPGLLHALERNLPPCD